MKTDYSPLTVSHSHRHTDPSNGFYWRSIHFDIPTIKTGDNSTLSRKLCDGDLTQLNFDRCVSLNDLCNILTDTLGIGDQGFSGRTQKLT